MIKQFCYRGNSPVTDSLESNLSSDVGFVRIQCNDEFIWAMIKIGNGWKDPGSLRVGEKYPRLEISYAWAEDGTFAE